MSEQTPVPEPDTPAVGGPEGAATEGTDWHVRYDNLRPEFDRATQEREEARQEREELRNAVSWYELLVTSEDPDIRAQAAEALGIEFDEEEEQPADDGYQDPFEPYDARISALEEHDARRDADQQELEHVRAVRDVLDSQLEELMPGAQHPDQDIATGVKFDQDQVLAYAINALPVGEDGLPPIALAHQLWQERNDARQQDWARSKRAPMFSPGGQTATEVPNLDNDQERQEYMTRRLQANLEP